MPGRLSPTARLATIDRMRTRRIGRSALLGLGLTGALAAASLVGTGWGAGFTFERASVASDGTESNNGSDSPALSAGGRYVAFVSEASNLVLNDVTGARDVFVHDRIAQTTDRVSVASNGTEGNDHSFSPALSGDGRYVVFASDADNLVPNDTNLARDIFVRDRMTSTTTRVSVAGNGTQGSNDSETPSISADGRYVTFTSLAINLVAGDTNNDRDVFVHELSSGISEIASLSTSNTQGNFGSGGVGAGPGRISDDGRYVVFGSFASNLVPGDTNSADDIFVRDRALGTLERVSIGDGEEQGNDHSVYGSISNTGRFVAFTSASTNLVAGDTNGLSDIFLRDVQANTTIRLSEAANGDEADAAGAFAVVSRNSTVVAFQSAASNLVPGDGNATTDVFRFDIATGQLSRISVPAAGTDANGPSAFAAVSEAGDVFAFQSSASNLIAGDGNGQPDIFALIQKPLPTPTATATAIGGATQTPGPGTTPRPTGTAPSGGTAPSALPQTGAGGTSGTGGSRAFVLGGTLAGAGAMGGALLWKRRRALRR